MAQPPKIPLSPVASTKDHEVESVFLKNSSVSPPTRLSKCSNGFSIVADNKEDRCSTHLILNRGLSFECFQRIGARFALLRNSHNDVLDRQALAGETDGHGQFADGGFPILLILLMYLATGAKTCPAGNSVFQSANVISSFKTRSSVEPLQWAEQSFS